MKQYSGEEKVYVPDFEGIFEACAIKTGAPQRGKLSPISNVIVLTADELLHLMQEAIEHSHPVLTRDAADKFLASKLK